MAASKIDRSDSRGSVMVPSSTLWPGPALHKTMRDLAADPATIFQEVKDASAAWAAIAGPIELAPEPGAGVGPVAIRRALGHAQALGRLFQGQASEEAQLDQPGDRRLPGGQLRQRHIDGEQVGAGRVDGQL